ncbi:MAG: hypothetical protein ACXWT1_20400 [Methylobacter sp.]
MASLNSKTFLFDRLRQANHPWLDALNTLEKSAVPGHAPLAENWCMDARVDVAREQHINSSGCFPCDNNSKAFETAVWDYFVHFQCRSSAIPPLAAYVEKENSGSLIPADERPSRNHHLLHVASVNRLLQFIYRGGNENLADFQIGLRRLTDARSPSAINDAEVDKLIVVMQAKGAETVKKFARLISDTLGNSEPLWWAAFAHEFGDLQTLKDWTDVARKTGSGHLKRGDWLLAWRYSPEIAGRLYRPTVAEAGPNGFHFPSPIMNAYGITMPLKEGMPAVRELIHPPLKGEISEQACIGCFGKIEHDPVDLRNKNDIPAWFEKRRQMHGDYLAQQQPLAKDWLQRHGLNI